MSNSLPYLFILLELLGQFILSKLLFREISLFTHSLVKNRKIALLFFSFLFLPGTFVHELSHYIMAVILRVKVYSFTLWPKLEGDSIRLGSVEIAQTDVIRRFFIGAAPFIIGVSLITFMLFEFIPLVFTQHEYVLWIAVFIIFEISNSMFSSRKDMEGAGGVIVALAVSGILYKWLLAQYIHVSIPYSVMAHLTPIVHQLSLYLLIPIGIDLVLFLGVGLMLKIFYLR